MALVVLVVSPFTAPFSTIDQPMADPVHRECISASKTLQSEASVTPIVTAQLLSLTQTPVGVPAGGHVVDIPRLCQLVLRL